MEYLA